VRIGGRLCLRDRAVGVQSGRAAAAATACDEHSNGHGWNERQLSHGASIGTSSYALNSAVKRPRNGALASRAPCHPWAYRSVVIDWPALRIPRDPAATRDPTATLSG
jgi:hypothetical protein